MTRIISDVKQDFEGGTSFAVDWNSMVRQGVENMLDEVYPETLKRRVPIYGGLASEVNMYYCPTDRDWETSTSLEVLFHI